MRSILTRLVKVHRYLQLQTGHFDKYYHGRITSITDYFQQNKKKVVQNVNNKKKREPKLTLPSKTFIPVPVLNKQYLSVKFQQGGADNGKANDSIYWDVAYRVLLADVFLGHRNAEIRLQCNRSEPLGQESGNLSKSETILAEKELTNVKNENEIEIVNGIEIENKIEIENEIDGAKSNAELINVKENSISQYKTPVINNTVPVKLGSNIPITSLITSDLNLDLQYIPTNPEDGYTSPIYLNKQLLKMLETFIKSTEEQQHMKLVEKKTEAIYNLLEFSEYEASGSIVNTFGYKINWPIALPPKQNDGSTNIVKNQNFTAFLPTVFDIFNVVALGYTSSHPAYHRLCKLQTVPHPLDRQRKIKLVDITKFRYKPSFYNTKYEKFKDLLCLVPANYTQDYSICQKLKIIEENFNGDKKIDIGVENDTNTENGAETNSLHNRASMKDIERPILKPLFDMHSKLNKDLLPQTYLPPTNDEIVSTSVIETLSNRIIEDLGLQSQHQLNHQNRPEHEQHNIVILKLCQTFLRNTESDEEICLTEYVNGIPVVQSFVLNVLDSISPFRKFITKNFYGSREQIGINRNVLVKSYPELVLAKLLGLPSHVSKDKRTFLIPEVVNVEGEPMGNGSGIARAAELKLKRLFRIGHFLKAFKQLISLDFITSRPYSVINDQGINGDMIRGMLMSATPLNDNVSLNKDNKITGNKMAKKQVVISDSALLKEQLLWKLLLEYCEWYKLRYGTMATGSKQIKTDVLAVVHRQSLVTKPWDYYIARRAADTISAYNEAYAAMDLATMNQIGDEFLIDFATSYWKIIKNELAVENYTANRVMRERNKIVHYMLGGILYHLTTHIFHNKYPMLCKYYFEQWEYKTPDAYLTARRNDQVYSLGETYLKYAELLDLAVSDATEFSKQCGSLLIKPELVNRSVFSNDVKSLLKDDKMRDVMRQMGLKPSDFKLIVTFDKKNKGRKSSKEVEATKEDFRHSDQGRRSLASRLSSDNMQKQSLAFSNSDADFIVQHFLNHYDTDYAKFFQPAFDITAVLPRKFYVQFRQKLVKSYTINASDVTIRAHLLLKDGRKLDQIMATNNTNIHDGADIKEKKGASIEDKVRELLAAQGYKMPKDDPKFYEEQEEANAKRNKARKGPQEQWKDEKPTYMVHPKRIRKKINWDAGHQRGRERT